MREYSLGEFYALHERWKESQYSYDYRASLIAAVNINKNKESDHLPWDYFVRPQFRNKEEKPQEQESIVIPQLSSTPEELIACFGPDFDINPGGAH